MASKWYVTKKPSSDFQLYDFARSAEQAKNMLRDLSEGSPIAHKSSSEGGIYNIYVKKGSILWRKKGGNAGGGGTDWKYKANEEGWLEGVGYIKILQLLKKDEAYPQPRYYYKVVDIDKNAWTYKDKFEKIDEFAFTPVKDLDAAWLKDVRAKYAKGGAVEHGLKMGDTIKSDIFWDETVVVENKRKKAMVDLNTGERKEEKMKDGGKAGDGIRMKWKVIHHSGNKENLFFTKKEAEEFAKTAPTSIVKKRDDKSYEGGGEIKKGYKYVDDLGVEYIIEIVTSKNVIASVDGNKVEFDTSTVRDDIANGHWKLTYEEGGGVARATKSRGMSKAKTSTWFTKESGLSFLNY